MRRLRSLHFCLYLTSSLSGAPAPATAPVPVPAAAADDFGFLAAAADAAGAACADIISTSYVGGFVWLLSDCVCAACTRVSYEHE